jgi:hypothetical protein
MKKIEGPQKRREERKANQESSFDGIASNVSSKAHMKGLMDIANKMN